MKTIYLDHNATTPTRPEVVEAMVRCFAEGYANPASQHQPGQRARRVLEDAREQIAAILGADLACPLADRLIFTSSGTEANNLAVLGIARAGGKEAGQIIISSVEHQSVIEPAEHLLEQGWRLDTLSVTAEGIVRGQNLSPLIGEQTRLVSVIWGNHETGVLQPVGELAQICNRAGIFFHTDAVQVVGKMPVGFRSLGAAAMSLAAHKFQGPLGIGALILRHDVPIVPLEFGGHQQQGIRPGTESVVLAVGMLTALELWQKEQQTQRNQYGIAAPAIRRGSESRLAGDYRSRRGGRSPAADQQYCLSRTGRSDITHGPGHGGRGLFGGLGLFQRFDGAFAHASGDGTAQ